MVEPGPSPNPGPVHSSQHVKLVLFLRRTTQMFFQLHEFITFELVFSGIDVCIHVLQHKYYLFLILLTFCGFHTYLYEFEYMYKVIDQPSQPVDGVLVVLCHVKMYQSVR